MLSFIEVQYRREMVERKMTTKRIRIGATFDKYVLNILFVTFTEIENANFFEGVVKIR